MEYKVEILSQEQVIPLRHAVLRKNQPVESCYYLDDEMQGCFHLGVTRDESVNSIASFYPQSHKDLVCNQPYRLRGMATNPAYQGQGLGKKLLLESFEILKSKNADVLWCNARITALPFYKKLNFQVVGTEFEIEGIGPHYLMMRRI